MKLRRIDEFLTEQASAYGCTKGQFAQKLLAAHAQRQHLEKTPALFEIKTHADARAWILSQNPHLYDKNRPHTDFRELAHQDHPY